MATIRPKAVVMSASAIPAVIAAIPPEPDEGGHAREGVDDAHRGAEQADERRRGAHRREHCEAALQDDDLIEHFTLDGALCRVDVGHRDRAVHDQRLDFAEGAAEHAGDVRLLVRLGQLDRFAEVVFLEELRELRRELQRLGLGVRGATTTSEHTVEGPDGTIANRVNTIPFANIPIELTD